MNERGFVSLTALLIVLMLAYLIRGTSFTAGNYADMTRNFETESRLQLAADSVLAETICSYTSKTFTSIEEVDQKIAFDNEVKGSVDDLSFAVRVSRKGTRIIILAVAKKGNYFATNLNAYRSACGFLKEDEFEVEDETGAKTTMYRYKFGGLLSRSV